MKHYFDKEKTILVLMLGLIMTLFFCSKTSQLVGTVWEVCQEL